MALPWKIAPLNQVSRWKAALVKSAVPLNAASDEPSSRKDAVAVVIAWRSIKNLAQPTVRMVARRRPPAFRAVDRPLSRPPTRPRSAHECRVIRPYAICSWSCRR
jgi:hypothetical protein